MTYTVIYYFKIDLIFVNFYFKIKLYIMIANGKQYHYK